jgi:hypothetical protein
MLTCYTDYCVLRQPRSSHGEYSTHFGNSNAGNTITFCGFKLKESAYSSVQFNTVIPEVFIYIYIYI